MRAKLVSEAVNFQRGNHPHQVLKIGRKHIIELPSGAEIEGPLVNKKKAEAILPNLEEELERTRMECEEEEIYDDQQMDILDDVENEYMEDFRNLGYEYTEDWQ